MNVDFFCCSLKRHTYFLMINYISTSVLLGMLTTTELDLATPANFMIALILRYILIMMILTIAIFGVIAFFFYVFTNNVHTGFIKFYSRFLFLAIISCFVLAVSLLTLTLFGLFFPFESVRLLGVLNRRHDGYTVNFTISLGYILAIVLLGFLIFWSIRLQKVVHSDEEPQQTHDEEFAVNQTAEQPILLPASNIKSSTV